VVENCRTKKRTSEENRECEGWRWMFLKDGGECSRRLEDIPWCWMWVNDCTWPTENNLYISVVKGDNNATQCRFVEDCGGQRRMSENYWGEVRMVKDYREHLGTLEYIRAYWRLLKDGRKVKGCKEFVNECGSGK
jgi:hypothetical protein